MSTYIKTYEQQPFFDPFDPNRVERVQYAGIPGTYGSWYWKVVPTQAKSLTGALGDITDSIPGWMMTLAVLAGSTALGYFGWQKFGGGIKRKLGLSGHRRRKR